MKFLFSGWIIISAIKNRVWRMAFLLLCRPYAVPNTSCLGITDLLVNGYFGYTGLKKVFHFHFMVQANIIWLLGVLCYYQVWFYHKHSSNGRFGKISITVSCCKKIKIKSFNKIWVLRNSNFEHGKILCQSTLNKT